MSSFYRVWLIRVKFCWIIFRSSRTRLSRCGQQCRQYGGRHGCGGAFGVVACELGYDYPGIEGRIPNDAVYFIHFVFSFSLFEWLNRGLGGWCGIRPVFLGVSGFPMDSCCVVFLDSRLRRNDAVKGFGFFR